MALRHSLKRFASSTALSNPSSFAFAPALSNKVGFGQRAYSTVIEGLKYASSHEWYVVASLSLFFFRRVLFVASLCPFFVVCGFTDDDDILSLWDAILKRRRRRRKTPFACDDQGSIISTLDDDDDAPFVVALEQRGDAI